MMRKKLFSIVFLSLMTLCGANAASNNGYNPDIQPPTMQYFTPVGGKYFVGDCIPFYHDGTYYLYWLLDEGHHSALGGLGGHRWCVSTTTDLVTWQHHPVAIGLDEEWEKSICTGSVVWNNNVFYAFYATRLLNGSDVCERLSYATSSDGLTYEKQLPNPFYESAEGFSQRNFRDPKVVIDDEGVFHLFVASERTTGDGGRGCLVHMTSTNMKDWTVEGTLIEGLSAVPECPDYFKWGEWYYLVFGQGLRTHYVMSKNPYGPWQWPETQALKGEWIDVVKTAEFNGGRRIAAGWVPSRSDGRDSGGWAFGGTVALREVYQLANGELATRFPVEVMPKAEEPKAATITAVSNAVAGNAAVEINAQGGTGRAYAIDVPRNCIIKMNIDADANATEYGLRLRAGENGDNGYILAMQPGEKKVKLAKDAWMDNVERLSGKITLTVVMKDDIIDAEIDGRRCIINRLPDQNGNYLWIYANGGKVSFSDITISQIIVSAAEFDENTLLPSYFIDKYNYPVKAMVFNDGKSYSQWSGENGGKSGVALGTPPTDANGKNWYDTDYQLTNNGNRKWKDMTSPMGTGTWANDNISADIYLRRSFVTDKAIEGRVEVRSCFDDAPCEIYLNGVLLVAYPDGDPDGSLSARYLLSDEQTALIKTDGSENVLAMHVHNDWGGSNADLGLYTAEQPYIAFTTHNYGTQYGNIVVADLMNDGSKELIVAGTEGYSASRPRWLLKNTDGQWADVGNTINCVDRPSLNICDFNGDGNIDIVCFENRLPTAGEIRRNRYTTDKGIFLGNGDGTFQKMVAEIVGAEDNLPANFTAPFDNLYKLRAGAVADFNCDGRPDIVGLGVGENNVVLLNEGIEGNTIRLRTIYFDNGIIPNSSETRGRSFSEALVLTADFNNDGYADFIVSANNWDYRQNVDADWERFTEVYINDGTGKKFNRTYWALTNPTVYNGGLAIADFDNDGYLDVYVSGDGGYFPGTPKAKELTGTDDQGYWEHTFVCINDGTGHFQPLPTESFDRFSVRGLNSVANVANAYDWDGDGNIDILHQGWCNDLNAQNGFIWINNGSSFSRSLKYGGGSESAAVLADWDGDGLKDIVQTGYCNNWDFIDHNYSDGRSFIVTLCPEQPTERPDAPAAVEATQANGRASIKWTPAATAQKNTTYELYIQSEDGTLLGNCRAYTDGAMNGVRKVEEFGNMGTVNAATFRLLDGNYTVGVQAVDGRRNGSTFTTAQFSIIDGEATAIAQPTAQGRTTHKAYTLTGQYIGTSTDNAAPGIYIIDNKKIAVK